MDLCSVGEIRELLGRHGFKFSKSLGQNFIIDGAVPEQIAGMSGIDDSFGVLEIGPGIGTLTEQLCRRAAKVVSVELDKRLLPVLAETLSECENAEVVGGDILKIDIGELLELKMPGMRYAVCANLPYNITTPVLTKLIGMKRFEAITVMVQREVAMRLCAQPGTPEYGAITVFTSYHTVPEILFDVAPESFMPRPKVYSTVMKMKKRLDKPDCVGDEEVFFRVVRASFAMRRKTLVNGLGASFGDKFSKGELTEIVTCCGLDEKVRGETLGIGEFAAVARALEERLK